MQRGSGGGGGGSRGSGGREYGGDNGHFSDISPCEEIVAIIVKLLSLKRH